MVELTTTFVGIYHQKEEEEGDVVFVLVVVAAFAHPKSHTYWDEAPWWECLRGKVNGWSWNWNRNSQLRGGLD